MYKTEDEVARDFKIVTNIAKFQTNFTITWEEMALQFYNYVENKRMKRSPQEFFDKTYAK